MFVSLQVVAERTETGLWIKVTTEEGHEGSVTLDMPEEPGSSYCAKLCLLDPPKGHAPKVSHKRRLQASRRQEEKLAVLHGGVRQRGSGNQPGYAGDVRADGRYRVEAKFTTKASYRVTREELYKIRSECGLGEEPVFAIDFKNPSSLLTEDSWVLVPKKVWERYVHQADDD